MAEMQITVLTCVNAVCKIPGSNPSISSCYVYRESHWDICSLGHRFYCSTQINSAF